MRAKIVVTVCAVLVVAGVFVIPNPHRPELAVSSNPVEQVLAQSQSKPNLSSPHLPAPTPRPESTAEAATGTNLWDRIMNGDFPHLSAEELEPYLAKYNRSKESLMGALAATGDRAFLREALEKNPNDPRLNYLAYFLGDGRAADTSAKVYDPSQPASAERRQLLDTFAKNAPDNALPNYLLALDCFKAGRNDQAAEQLAAAAQKSKFQDYSLDYIQDAEEAYRAAGWSEAQAKLVASAQLPLPHLAELKQTGFKTVELAALYRQAGDEASAVAVEQVGLGLGQRMDQPGQLTMIQELVGIAIERKILGSMDPTRALDGTGQTVQDRLELLNQRKKSIKTLAGVTDLYRTLSESEVISYSDRIKLFGETTAAEWLLRTHNKLPAEQTSQIR